MKKGLYLTIFFQLALISSTTLCAYDNVETRSQVATGDFTWNAQNFAGLYYDIKNDIGAEWINFQLTEGNKLSGDASYGVTYQTVAQSKGFAFGDWGSYSAIGYLSDLCFASYMEGPDESPMAANTADKNQLSSEQLLRVLIDDANISVIEKGESLKLKEGYELMVKGINSKGDMYLELLKDGKPMDVSVIPHTKVRATVADRTYCYRNPGVGDAKNVVTIAVHFAKSYSRSSASEAIVDGIWQLSEIPVPVKADKTYGKMTIRTVDASALIITMDNKDNAITLSKNKDISLMPGFGIRTGDNDTLRYYLYKQISKPERYEARGQVAVGDFTWNPQNFAGFYYDIDKDIGTETLTTRITDGYKLSGDERYGIIYDSTAQAKDFEFRPWGSYYTMGFMAKRYFAAYNKKDANVPMVSQTTDRNMLVSEQLLQILADDDNERAVGSGTPLRLSQGYELAVKSIGEDGSVDLELLKDGQAIDSKAVTPSKDFATMADKTYCYVKPDVGGARNVAIIAVHFKNAYSDEENNSLAIIDGLWQLSDTPLSIKAGTTYDKMTMDTVSADGMNIIMNNKGNALALSKGEDISLMPGIRIRVADNGTLRYYIYRPADEEEY